MTKGKLTGLQIPADKFRVHRSRRRGSFIDNKSTNEWSNGQTDHQPHILNLSLKQVLHSVPFSRRASTNQSLTINGVQNNSVFKNQNEFKSKDNELRPQSCKKLSWHQSQSMPHGNTFEMSQTTGKHLNLILELSTSIEFLRQRSLVKMQNYVSRQDDQIQQLVCLTCYVYRKMI